MDKKNLSRIRTAVLNDLADFVPPKSYLPIHFPGYINPADWDVVQRMKIKQASNPQRLSLRQHDALSLFEKIIALAEAEKDERNYKGTDSDEIKFNRKYTKDALRFLKESLDIYIRHLEPKEAMILLAHCDEFQTIESTKFTNTIISKPELKKTIVAKKGRREMQMELILECAEKLQFDLQSIPYGGKKKIEIMCLENKELFTYSSFGHAWRRANKNKLIKVENKEKYLTPHKTK